ncbi:phosphonate C-P lyase system protein PhnL [Mesorhizobium tianshanense]|nr:phosphonate C-P lyase system protein PhnL [Mesorhizobium tianshanense]
MNTSDIRLHARGLSKTFVLHTQGGVHIPVFDGIELKVASGECVCLHGPSGAGKSTLLRSLYANYKPDAGEIRVRHDGTMIDLLMVEPWEVVEIRRRTIGYVSQFLRVIPRVPTLDIVAEPAIVNGVASGEAHAAARTLLSRLRIPERLWSLAPATFSGGEQQRVNIARGFIVDYPVLLLDEPTASLDAANRQTVIELINEAKARGTAIFGIFHDEEVREAVADRLFEVGKQPLRKTRLSATAAEAAARCQPLLLRPVTTSITRRQRNTR